MRTVGELHLRARATILADCGVGDISVLCAGGRLGNVYIDGYVVTSAIDHHAASNPLTVSGA